MESNMKAVISTEGSGRANADLKRLTEAAARTEDSVNKLERSLKDNTAQFALTSKATELARQKVAELKTAQDGTKKSADKLARAELSLEKAVLREGKAAEKLAVDSKRLKAEKEKLSKANKDVADSGKLSLESMKANGAAAKATAVAVIATATAYTALGVAVANSVRETSNQARIAGESIGDYEALGFAVSQFSLTADQFSDSMKDVRERVGEFVADGTGGFEDFLSVIGATKERSNELAAEFNNLSGRDVVGRMVEEMERAGVSTNEMSFALEGVASDLTKVIPLFTDGSRELGRLEAKVGAVTRSLTEDEVGQYRDLAENVDLVTEAFSNMVQVNFVPAISGVNELAGAVAFYFASLTKGTQAQLTSQMAELDEEIDRLEEKLSKPARKGGRGGAVYNDFVRAQDKKNLDEAREQLESVTNQYKELAGLTLPDRPEVPPVKTGAPTGGKPSGSGLNASDQSALDSAKARADAELAIIAGLNDSKLEAVNRYEQDQIARLEELNTKKAEFDNQSLISDEQYQIAKTEIQINAQAQRDEIILANKTKEDEAREASLEADRQAWEERNALAIQAGEVFKSSAASNVIEAIKGQKSIKDATLDTIGAVAESTAKAAIETLIQQQVIDRIAGKSFLVAKSAEVATTVAQAGLNAFAATAAIPIVGPAAAPIAAAAATTAASALGGAVIASAALRYQGGAVAAGQATSYAEKGEIEVLAPASSSRIRTKQQMESLMGSSSGGAQLSLVIIDQSTGQKSFEDQGTDDEGRMVILIRNTVSNDFADNNSKITKQLRSSNNITPNR